MKISASMIVKNEQKCISACLESLRGIDEIVILDTGSTDATPEICGLFPVRFIAGEYTWADNFAEARNESLKRCTGDWILIIDADERLISTSEAVRAEIDRAGNDRVLMVTMISEKLDFWSPRIFKNHVGIHWRGAIHNYLTETGTKKTDIDIEYGYSENHSKDPDRSMRILKKEVEKSPGCVREKYYLAREHYYRKNYNQAIHWFNEYLKVASWAPEMADAWCTLARCYTGVYKHPLARNACLQAIAINADFAEPMRIMADLSGPKNREKWTVMADHCKNDDVLFVRKTDPVGLLK